MLLFEFDSVLSLLMIFFCHAVKILFLCVPGPQRYGLLLTVLLSPVKFLGNEYFRLFRAYGAEVQLGVIFYFLNDV